jgi:hypothetical protein
MVPGPGERVFAGTQEYEMSFAAPYSKFETLIYGLKCIRSRGAYRYPVPNLAVLSEPRIPGAYHQIISQESTAISGRRTGGATRHLPSLPESNADVGVEDNPGQPLVHRRDYLEAFPFEGFLDHFGIGG